MEAKQQKGRDHGHAGPSGWVPQCLGCTRGVRLPRPEAAGAPVRSQHALGPRPAPGPPLAVSPPVTGCLHLHPTPPPPESGGAPALPTYRLRWSIHAGTGHLVSLAAALAGLGRGAEQHRPAVQKREYSWGKALMGRSKQTSGATDSADRGLAPLPFSSDVSWDQRCLEPQDAGGAVWWRHKLEFAVPPSLLRSHSPVILAVLGFHSKQRAAVRFCPCCVFQGIQSKVVIQMW